MSREALLSAGFTEEEASKYQALRDAGFSPEETDAYFQTPKGGPEAASGATAQVSRKRPSSGLKWLDKASEVSDAITQNFIPDAWNGVVVPIASSVAHLIDTTKGLVGMARGGLDATARAVLPAGMSNPKPSAQEQQFRGAVVDPLKRVAEDPSIAAQWAVEHPAQAALIASGVAGAGARAAGAANLPKIADTLGVVRDATNWVSPSVKTGATLTREALQGVPESLYARSTKIPPGSVSDAKRTQIIDTLVNKEKIPLGKKSLSTIAARNADIGTAIDDALSQLSATGSSSPVQPVLDRLESLKSKFANRLDWQEVNSVIDDVKTRISDHPLAQNGQLSIEGVRDLKRGIGNQLEEYYRTKNKPETGRVGIKNKPEAQAMDAAASELRDTLLNHPDVPASVKADLRRQAGLMQARQWVERAVNRGGNLDPIGLSSLVFSALRGNVGDAAAWRIAFSQPVQTRAAIALGRVGRVAEKGTRLNPSGAMTQVLSKARRETPEEGR